MIKKYIDLSVLPTDLNNKIDWGKSINKSVTFQYGDITDSFKILNHKNRFVKIFNPKYGEFDIDSGNLKKCALGKFLKIYTDEFRFEIGDVLTDNNRDVIIIDRKYEILNQTRYDKQRDKERKIQKKEKYYKIRCNKDKYENWILESNLLKGVGCPLCTNIVVIKGKNDIATTRPNLQLYFNNIEDSYKYTEKSHVRLNFKCPYCKTIKEMRMADFVNKGFSCPVCNDGFSYPEKFMHSVLIQANINFIHQLSSVNFKWVGRYRYDFYLVDYNTIIEVNGDQHYNSRKNFSRKNKRKEKENDNNKYLLAKKNGINNYIIIDASVSSIEWMKENIVKSYLSKIIDFDKIDWEKCEIDARKSKIYEICKIKKNNPKLTSNEISDITGVERSVIVDYLKLGKNLGWCTYDSKEEQRLSAQRNRPRKKIAVKNDNNEVLGVFDSCSELERQSVKLFGFRMHFTEVAKRCNPKSNKYKTKYHEFTIEEIKK